MRIIDQPRVALVAETASWREGLEQYLSDIGAPEFTKQLDQVTSGAEEICIVGGKLCYRSFKKGLNPNVTKTRDNPEQYVNNINRIGHGSVIEHGYVTFVFYDVSRVFTHEIVRHRVGTAMSQESLRYVRLTDLSFWMPTILKEHDNDHGDGVALVKETVEHLEEVQAKLARIYGIEDLKSFSTKKKLTSAFRRVAPIGLGTSIMWSMNLRAARHLIQLRTSRHAEEEIRVVFDKVASIMKERFPFMFQDMRRREVDGCGEWYTPMAAMPYDSEKIATLTKALDKIAELDHHDAAREIAAKALKDVGHEA